MERQELDKHYGQVDCENFTVFRRKALGLLASPLSGEEKENVFAEIINSLITKHPNLKEKIKF